MLAILSTSSMSKQTKHPSLSSMASMYVNNFDTNLPLSENHLESSDWASSLTNTNDGYFLFSRIDSCCARPWQREVFPVPVGFQPNEKRVQSGVGTWIAIEKYSMTPNTRCSALMAFMSSGGDRD